MGAQNAARRGGAEERIPGGGGHASPEGRTGSAGQHHSGEEMELGAETDGGGRGVVLSRITAGFA